MILLFKIEKFSKIKQNLKKYFFNIKQNIKTFIINYFIIKNLNIYKILIFILLKLLFVQKLEKILYS